jgi:hypothetical protein
MDLRLTLDHLKWLLASFLLALASLVFAYYIFPSQSSILAISFIVAGLTPPLWKMISDEELVVAHEHKSFIQRYDGILANLLLMAIGLFLAFSVAQAAMPSGMLASLFSLQSAQPAHQRDFGAVASLMLFCFAFSLFFGAGAILIIAWDLSTLVAVLGGPAAFMLYLPQLIAFFLTGLAGALLSFAIVQHEWREHGFYKVLKDSLALMCLSLLIIAATHFLLPSP